MSQVPASDTLREWRDSAAYWAKHSHTIRKMFAPVTAALIEDARITEGQSVLDVAGGAGEPTLTIAKRVGTLGSVACTDAVAEMVAAAENEARRLGLTNIEFRQCAADSLPFEKDSFDAVVSRLGVMFFPDPLGALRDMLRVLKPGGSISLAVWHKSELNPFSYLVTNVLARHIETPPADPDAPNAFRFAEPGKLTRILSEAGAVDVSERELQFSIEAPISPAEFWELRSETSGSLREKLKALPREQARRIESEVLEAIADLFPHRQMSFPAWMIIVTGRKIF